MLSEMDEICISREWTLSNKVLHICLMKPGPTRQRAPVASTLVSVSRAAISAKPVLEPVTDEEPETIDWPPRAPGLR